MVVEYEPVTPLGECARKRLISPGGHQPEVYAFAHKFGQDSFPICALCYLDYYGMGIAMGRWTPGFNFTLVERVSANEDSGPKQFSKRTREPDVFIRQRRNWQYDPTPDTE